MLEGEGANYGILVACSVVGIVWAVVNAYLVSRVQPFNVTDLKQKLTMQKE